MKWKGIINNKEGYINVMETPSNNSKIIKKILKDELFYYTPIGNNEWWPVSLKEGEKYIGYIHKCKVLNFPDFPKRLKEKLEKDSHG